MNSELEKYLQIRYVSLHFELQMLEKCLLPDNKASALRGGMGQMLMQTNCIRNKKCEECDFRADCLKERIMYSPFEIRPRFVSKGESAGYIIECENYENSFDRGDILSFRMILFGKTIAYFSQILQAFYQLGQVGLGKEQGRFAIVGITNTNRESLLQGNNIYKERYQVRTIAEYVDYRMKRPRGDRMLFHTPVTLKYNSAILTAFNSEAIVRALTRRLLMLDCFEGIESEQLQFDRIPTISDQRVKGIDVKRYTTRQKRKIHMDGIRGYVDLDDIDEDLYILMLAGEIMHIGKNTSFGFGRYTMVERR